jgi:hypothetical protein
MTSRMASVYCADQGFPLAEATLVKLRCVGGGPAFIRYGRRVFYRPADIDAWIAERTQELRCTSEVADHVNTKEAA